MGHKAAPPPERPEKLGAYIDLPKGNGVDEVTPTRILVVDEAYPADPDYLHTADLVGGEQATDRATQTAASKQLAQAGYQAGEWKTNRSATDGTLLGWRYPARRTP